MWRIGIDLGGTKTEIAALDRAGAVRLRRRAPTPPGYAGVIGLVGALMEAAEAELGGPATVGIGIPGSLSPATGLVRGAIDPFTGGPILLATLVEIVDGGSPGVGRDVLTWLPIGVVASSALSCPARMPPGGTTSTVRGPLGPDEPAPFFPNRPLGQDLFVTDAPAPATKRDCQSGGWKRFGFRSQGACVPYVKRRAKP